MLGNVDVSEHICKTIHRQSEKWFSKTFTMNKILNSLESPFKKIDNGNFILNLSINKMTSFFNRYKSLMKITDIEDYFKLHNNNNNIDIICLIKLFNLEFFENKFTYNFQLEQAKIFTKEEKLIKYSIIDSVINCSDYSDCNEIESNYNFSN